MSHVTAAITWPLSVAHTPRKTFVSAAAAFVASRILLLQTPAAYAIGAAVHYLQHTSPDVSGQQCPYYGQWPGSNDCAGWVSFFSSGYPTVAERGTQAENMMNDNQWQNICNSAQFDEVQANTYAYGLNGYTADIAVYGIKGNVTDKSMLCKIAQNILTPPVNQCQLQDWKDNYMFEVSKDTMNTLNLWKSYC